MSRYDLCPDCDGGSLPELNRRDFVRVGGTAAAAAAVGTIGSPLIHSRASAAETEKKVSPENLVKKLYDSLSEEQRGKVCFAWDHTDDRGLLRTHVSNNWNVTDRQTLNVGGSFFTKDQQDLIEALFYGLYNPEWHDRIRKQLKDDAGGYGRQQTLALFGEPGSGQFEFVMTGRHLTIRCDGDSVENMAFGGPIFYGHAAQGFDEKPDHPGNVFWPQAVKANALYKMLDGKQRERALIAEAPYESDVAFRGPDGEIPGLPVSELSSDQREHAQEVLNTLLEPYRTSSQQEARTCLEAQGGLDKLRLAFYKSDDVGGDEVWDNWRIEGPSFVWHFRGAPHVHVWVNVGDDPSVKLNADG